MSAAAVAVQYIPAAPMSPDLHFDHHQFKRRLRAISIATCISNADYGSMQTRHIKTSRNKKWLPAWAFNDFQFRQVLKLRCWQYVHGGEPMPSDLTLQDAAREADEYGRRDTNHKYAEWARHKEHVERAGGYSKLMARVLYLSFRMGWNSPVVAEETGLQAPNVRIMLYRANLAARKLGFEVHVVQHHSWTGGVARDHSFWRDQTRVYNRDFRRANRLGLTVNEYRAKFGRYLTVHQRRFGHTLEGEVKGRHTHQDS